MSLGVYQRPLLREAGVGYICESRPNQDPLVTEVSAAGVVAVVSAGGGGGAEVSGGATEASGRGAVVPGGGAVADGEGASAGGVLVEASGGGEESGGVALELPEYVVVLEASVCVVLAEDGSVGGAVTGGRSLGDGGACEFGVEVALLLMVSHFPGTVASAPFMMPVQYGFPVALS